MTNKEINIKHVKEITETAIDTANETVNKATTKEERITALIDATDMLQRTSWKILRIMINANTYKNEIKPYYEALDNKTWELEDELDEYLSELR